MKGWRFIEGVNLLPTTRTCEVCGAEFSGAVTQVVCSVECRKVRKSQMFRKWLADNPGYMARYKSTDQYKAQARAYARRYREQNLEAVRSSFKAWEERNPKHTSDWYRRNPEQGRESVRRRRARLQGAETFEITPRDIRRMWSRQRGCCAYCGRSLPNGYHVDHVIPVSRGGRNSVGNLVIACPECNLSKGARFVSEWRLRKPLS